jgi:hypothetical protein
VRGALPPVVLRAVCFVLAIFMIINGDWVDAMDSSRDGGMRCDAMDNCCCSVNVLGLCFQVG